MLWEKVILENWNVSLKKKRLGVEMMWRVFLSKVTTGNWEPEDCPWKHYLGTQMLRAGRTREEMSFRQQRDCVSPLFSFMEVNKQNPMRQCQGPSSPDGQEGRILKQAAVFLHQKHSLGELHQGTFLFPFIYQCVAQPVKAITWWGHPHPAESLHVAQGLLEGPPGMLKRLINPLFHSPGTGLQGWKRFLVWISLYF